jgi:excinuclease UvrABC ATPase subunit
VILGDPWITPDQLTPTDTAVFKTGKTRQTLAGALGILDKLTQLYASSLDARSHGLTQRAFAPTTPRSNPYLCSECGGLGIKLDYALNLPRPLACGCPVCHGRRFKAPVATILFRGAPYYQILNQPISQSIGALSALSKVKTTLKKVTELGLANLPLAMPVALLSLSERAKLAEIAR